MEFKLTREQKRLRKDVLCFAKEHLFDASENGNGSVAFSREVWKKCGELKITGLHVPDTHGGLGYDSTNTGLALEGLGAGGVGGGMITSLSAHLFSVVSPLLHFGTEAQKNAYLPSLADGTRMGASAMTEDKTGTWSDDLATVAEKDGDSFVLTGQKSFTINAPEADFFLIYAKAGDGITCFIVPKDASGLEVVPLEKSVGASDTPVGRVHLNEVRVPESAVLGSVGEGKKVFELAATWERGMLGSVYVGWLDNLVEMCIKEARTRKQGDLPIGKHQSVSHKVTDMKINLEVSRLLSRKAAWSLSQEQADDASAPISKLFASESVLQSALDAVHVFGDYSILKEFQLNATLQGALESNFLGGGAQAQRRAIVKALGL